MELADFVKDFADALCTVDQSGATHKNFKPGIGPFGEADAVKAALSVLQESHGAKYARAVIKRQPDLLIPAEWQLEIKVVRPYGDNGRLAEHWSENLLHPYPGNTSSLGDSLKLLESERPERRAILVFGFEHAPALTPVEPCVQSFELLARDIIRVRLSSRIQEMRSGLRHPVHQVLRVYAWEVLGHLDTADSFPEMNGRDFRRKGL